MAARTQTTISADRGTPTATMLSDGTGCRAVRSQLRDALAELSVGQSTVAVHDGNGIGSGRTLRGEQRGQVDVHSGVEWLFHWSNSSAMSSECVVTSGQPLPSVFSCGCSTPHSRA